MGTFTKAGGSGTTYIRGTIFNNRRDVNVLTGTLSLEGGGISTANFDLSAGITLSFPDNTYTLGTGTSITGAGVARVVSRGTLAVAGSAWAQNLEQSSGTISGSGNLTILDSFNWTGGTMSGLGSTSIDETAIKTIGGTSIKYLDRRALSSAGTVVFTGTTDIDLDNGASFNNSGTFEVQNDHGFHAWDFALAYFYNNGAFSKSVGYRSSTIGVNFTNMASLTVSTGTLAFACSLVQYAGTTNLAGGNISASSGLDVRSGRLMGTGIITGSVTNSGEVSPGSSPETLTISGNYTQTLSGTLNVEIGGRQGGTQYDRLRVAGNASLNGTLSITRSNGFSPSLADTFLVMTYTSRMANSAFQMVTGTDAGNGLYFVEAYSPNDAVLDFNLLKTNFGQIGCGPMSR